LPPAEGGRAAGKLDTIIISNIIKTIATDSRLRCLGADEREAEESAAGTP
jgi:hypothetical protein